MRGRSLCEGQEKYSPGSVKSKFNGCAEGKSLVGSRATKNNPWLWEAVVEEINRKRGGGVGRGMSLHILSTKGRSLHFISNAMRTHSRL